MEWKPQLSRSRLVSGLMFLFFTRAISFCCCFPPKFDSGRRFLVTPQLVSSLRLVLSLALAGLVKTKVSPSSQQGFQTPSTNFHVRPRVRSFEKQGRRRHWVPWLVGWTTRVEHGECRGDDLASPAVLFFFGSEEYFRCYILSEEQE